MRAITLGIGITLLSGCAPGAAAVEASDVELRLALEKPALAEGDKLEFTVEVVNHSDQKITIIRPVDRSFDAMREPLWDVEFLDEEGQVVPSALGYGPEGRCGMVNDLTPKDRYPVPAGGTVILSAEDLVWVPLAFEGPGISGAPLMVQMLDLEGSPQGKPEIIAKGDEYVGFSQLLATPSGFLALWTAGSGQGRMRMLGMDGTPAENTLAYEFAGQFVAAGVALEEEIQIVYSDASMSGQDRTDTMGLYLLRLTADGKPLAEPLPLSPRDREMARFGDAAWLPDGRFARVFDERGPLQFGIGDGPTTLLSDHDSGGGSAAIWAFDDRYVVAWADTGRQGVQ